MKNNRDYIRKLIGTPLREYLISLGISMLVVDTIYDQNVPKCLRGGSGNTRYLNQDRIKTILERTIAKSPKEWFDFKPLCTKKRDSLFWTEVIKKLTMLNDGSNKK